jgi:hypothetical protein
VYLRIKILILFLVMGLPLWGQSFTYSYIDPCTKALKTINADMSAPIVIAYYGQVKTFTYDELNNGTFDAWMNTTYNTYKSNSPCQGAIATTTTTNSSNQVSNIITNVQSLLNVDFSGLGGVSVNIGGTTSSGSNNVSNEKENNNGSSDNQNQEQNGSVGGGNGNNNNSNNGSSGNGNSGNGNNNSSESGEVDKPTEEQTQAQEDQQNINSQQSTKSTNKAKTEVQKPAILITGDIVGIQTKSDGAQDARGTMSFTRVKGDGTASLGLSGDYMVNAKIANVTAVRSWIGVNKKGHKNINVASLGVSVIPKSITSTGMIIRVNSIKNFTGLYGAAGTYGLLYEEEIISSMLIGGFMYKGQVTKSLHATIIAAAVYVPYQKFYTESWFNSKPIVVPFLNLNYKLTKTFGVGLTAGGTYIAGQDILNFQILCGGKLIL